VKSSLRFSVCVFLPVLCWIGTAAAQDQSPADEQAPAAAQQQIPPAPQQPPTAPAPDQPQTRPGIQAPPQIPKVPDVRQPGETGWWLGVIGWFPRQAPLINKGRQATWDTATLTNFRGKPKYARGVELGIAMGLHNALRFSYADMRASGNFTTPTRVRLWDQTYDAGTFIDTDYRLQRGKISFDYLTWPYPVESRRFRLKTLWQFQYTNIRAGFDAPKIPITDEFGNPFVDASGNPITYGVTNSRWFMGPEFGVGVAYFGGRHFRVEANAAGFAFPRRNAIWDADAAANVRYGKFELRFGAKGFHFKTNTEKDFFLKGTFYSGFVGLRWYSD
jgi:hypothetical protein